MLGNNFLEKHTRIVGFMFWLLLSCTSLSVSCRLFPLPKAILVSMGNIAILVCTVHFYLKIIIPRFFRKGKFGWYFLTFAGLVVISTLLSVLFVNLVANDGVFDLTMHPGRNSAEGKVGGRPVFVPSFFITLTIFFMVTVYQLANIFLEKERRNSELEKEKIAHELNFLRSQINPHFLFNALNNLHATVQLKPEKAGDYILKLGEMLRYVLEDCKKDKVSLANEINYIKNYIFFQKQKDEKLRNIQFDVSGDDPSIFYLEPMLFIALVENAFQHSYSENAENQHIAIAIHLKKGRLQFTTHNNLGDENDIPNSEKRNSFGVGLQNIKRRLELQCPQNHTFTHGIQNNEYIAELIIQPSPL